MEILLKIFGTLICIGMLGWLLYMVHKTTNILHDEFFDTLESLLYIIAMGFIVFGIWRFL